MNQNRTVSILDQVLDLTIDFLDASRYMEQEVHIKSDSKIRLCQSIAKCYNKAMLESVDSAEMEYWLGLAQEYMLLLKEIKR